MARQLAYLSAVLGGMLALHGCATPPAPPAPAAPDFASALQSVANADSAAVVFSPPAPCCERQTLPDFLGVTDACNTVLGCVDNVRNHLGLLFPGLEAVPPVLAITDPANLAEDAPPAVKAAAEIKAQEDAAAQKIKALRYLATIGCGGCYPDVEDALIAAMEDCTEEVRYEAVLAVRKTTGVPCVFCKHGACCTEKIQNKLRELAFDQVGPCCGGEPSPRVRRQARLALAECGPPVIMVEPEEPAPETPTEGPTEGPDADVAPPPEGPVPPPEPTPPADPLASAKSAPTAAHGPSNSPTPSVTPVTTKGGAAPTSASHLRASELRLIGARPTALPPPPVR